MTAPRPAPERAVLAAVCIGGVLGAEARYGLARSLPHHASGWPWATLLTNVAGCALIGVLMAAVERRGLPLLLRSFLGVGVLGGFTTFSTYELDAFQLLHAHRVVIALGYLVVGVLVCVAAVAVAGRFTRALVPARPGAAL